ncbi:arsenate reductase ArsC [Pseudomonas aeruginosa]
MKVLFLCTANSCRSILAEAIFNHLAPAEMRAFSAGSKPKGVVHPLSIRALHRAGIDSTGLHSKSHVAHQNLHPDLVITLCDSAAAEPCPSYFGDAVKIHWGLPDPDGHGGSQAEVDAVFDQTVANIRRRINALLSLPLAQVAVPELKVELLAIGRLPVQLGKSGPNH